MTKTAKDVLNMLDAAISPPVEKTPPPPPALDPAPGPSWLTVVALLNYANLPSKATREKLDGLGVLWKTELDGLNGFSQNDARHERVASLNAAVKTGSAKGLLTKSQLIERNSEIRRVIKLRAAKISREGCLIAADVLEQAAAALPKFKAQLIAQQNAILPEISHQLGKSPLEGLFAQMPRFIDAHIKNLRDNQTPMVNPSQLLK